ncbi:alpha/beta fold hydrolase [Ornithinicoccus hortensis]|uniref:Pimeloyl-ACP methyl ester carboxylesterase n=1 Tax=Ornithinicoccus hortensis TaxID=82346 RepID=A0A542YP79_9MICO|nr:alpha/beta hydrolase [Ornithinicoccus hortensis]TQL49912.1 pimeloyl-ACP methyl ester carboxylesterase [Ornithinicoccus hortensis]
MTDPTTHTLDLPGVTLTYDIRGDLTEATADRPALLLAASPMGASGFPTLAGHFTDRPVITYDPRGVERSVRSDGAGELTPEQHAADLHALLQALDLPAVDVFASSGGAVNALCLVSAHPDEVRTLVAHEPPAAAALPDAGPALAVCEDIYQTYQHEGMGPAMARFIAISSHQGPVPEDYLDGPAPDPAAFGLPTEDDGTRDDPLVGQNIRTITAYRPDVPALTTTATRVVFAVGEESGEELAARAGRAVAAAIGTEPVLFPGSHAGFLGQEYGPEMAGRPDEFAAALRRVLDGR